MRWSTLGEVGERLERSGPSRGSRSALLERVALQAPRSLARQRAASTTSKRIGRRDQHLRDQPVGIERDRRDHLPELRLRERRALRFRPAARPASGATTRTSVISASNDRGPPDPATVHLHCDRGYVRDLSLLQPFLTGHPTTRGWRGRARLGPPSHARRSTPHLNEVRR